MSGSRELQSALQPAAGDASRAGRARFRQLVLLASIFLVGACGLLYELAAGTAASYLMGDTVTQYSLVIGVFLAAMGVGAFATQWIKERLFDWFLMIQLLVALVGGFSSLLLFAAFAYLDDLTALMLLVTAACGTLVGMEIPLVLRLLKQGMPLRVSVAQVLALDYLGALGASICFPFVVIPLLGLMHAALAAGTVNALVAVVGTLAFWRELSRRKLLVSGQAICWGMLAAGWIFSSQTVTALENRLYPDEVILAESTPYQRIVITRRSRNDDVRLHLNGHLQFSSIDEYRYHEALVQPAAALCQSARTALILGGGDGMAAREILALAADVEQIDLVDIDPRVPQLFRTSDSLARLNRSSLRDPRVRVISEDAFAFLQKTTARYDLILADLPDPSDAHVNKLYTDVFYRLALARLQRGGVFATQATSPFYARRAFWCIVGTIESAARRDPLADWQVVPYQVEVPSFGGAWGFVLVVDRNASLEEAQFSDQNRYLTADAFRVARHFPRDMARLDTPVNRLLEPVLVRYHAQAWANWSQ